MRLANALVVPAKKEMAKVEKREKKKKKKRQEQM